MRKIKVERHKESSENTKLLILYPARMGMLGRAEENLFRFEGIKTTVMQEIVRDTDTDERIETKWTITAEFTELPSSQFSTNTAETKNGIDAVREFQGSESVFRHKRGVRFIRFGGAKK